MSEHLVHVGTALDDDLTLEADVAVIGTGAGGGKGGMGARTAKTLSGDAGEAPAAFSASTRKRYWRPAVT